MKTARTTREETRQIWLGGIILGLFVIIALLSSCTSAVAPTSSVTEISVTETPEACQGGDGEYTCNGLSDHVITLKGIPDSDSPYLLQITDEKGLRGEPKEKGLGCIFVVVGDLAFYNKEDVKKGWDLSTPVKSFSTSVTIIYKFTKEDLSAISVPECNEHINSVIASGTPIAYVPVYFSEANGMWKTFDSTYKIDAVENKDGTFTVTLTFTTWGDQPIGGGTRP